jgi:hypothetical protein
MFVLGSSLRKWHHLGMRGGGGRVLASWLILAGVVAACGSSSVTRVDPSGGSAGEGGAGSDAEGGTGADAGGEGGRVTGAAGGAGEASAGRPSAEGGEGGGAYGGAPFVGGMGGEVSEGGAPAEFGGLTVTTTPERQDFDLFDPAGHKIWIEVSDEQREFMNTAQSGGNPNPWGDYYTPSPSVTFADHVVVQEVEGLSVADYGKVAVSLGGGDSFRQWTNESIPNLALDVTAFVETLTLGEFERFELHNALVGGIYREVVAQRALRALGVPSVKTSFAFLGSSVWGESAWVPMVLVQPYDDRFCEDQAAELGGECQNVWYANETQGGDAPVAPTCLSASCEDERLNEFADVLAETPEGAGFADALADFVDWPRFFDFQCSTFLIDARRAGVVVVERDDGRFVWMPHALDMSSGNVESAGFFRTDLLSRGCNSDPECRADMLDACGELVEAFDQLNPHALVDDVRQAVDALGMRRSGDVERAEELRDWYLLRQTEAAAEFELYRGPLGPDGCPEVLELCDDGTCGTTQECQQRQCGGPPFIWCEAFQSCIYEFQYCPTCDGDASFFCGVDYSCRSSQDECAALCEDPMYPYCPERNTCDYWCDFGAGGRPGAGGMGGVAGTNVVTGGMPGAGGVGAGGAAGTGGSAGAPTEGGTDAGGHSG